MAINQLQLPPLINLPQPDFSVLGSIGQDLGAMRQRLQAPGLVGDAFGSQSAAPQSQPSGGVSLSELGRGPASASGAGITPAQTALLTTAAQKYGLDPNYILTAANIEGTTKNPASTADGLGQFIDKTAKQYGVVRGDDASAADGFARFTLDNKTALTKALGRDPTPGELYLAHQQGATGAIGLLTNPNATATGIVGQSAVVNNGGSPLQTAGDFANRWTGKFDGNSAIPANAQPAQYQGRGVVPQPTPGLTPEMAQRIGQMLTNPYTAKLAEALLQRYVVPPTPVKVGEGEVLVNPYTGQQVAQGQVKPAIIGEGGAAVNPATGQPIYQAPFKPQSVAEGAQLVDPLTGRAIAVGTAKPITVAPGSSAINPATGQAIFSAPLKPEAVAPGSVLVNPATGSPVYSAPNKPMAVQPGSSVISPDAGTTVYENKTGLMTPETLNSLAERFWLGDKSVFTGIPRGTAGAMILGQMQNAINDWGAAHGKAPQDIAFAQAQFANTLKTVEGFGVGKQGDVTRSLTVAVDHADTFKDLAKALDNPTDVRGLNAAVNEFKKQFGYDAPTNLDAAKQILSSEIAKAVQGGDVGEGDRVRLQDAMKNANSWEQLTGAIDKVYTPLLAGQLRGLKRQYLSNAQGATEESFNQKLSPRALKVLGSGGDASAQSAAPQMQTFTTPQEAYAAMKAGKLKSGDQFMTPDGRLRTAK